MTPMHAGPGGHRLRHPHGHSQRRGAVSVPVGPLARVHPHLGVQGRRRHGVPAQRADDAWRPAGVARQLEARPAATCSMPGSSSRHPQLRLRRRQPAQPDTAAAMAAAVNDWLIAEWLDKEPRLRASLVVPTRVPRAGRAGDRPRRRAPGLRPGAPAGPLGGAVRQPPLPADLRGGRAARSGRQPAVRRRARQPADRLRLAVVLHRGVRRHGPGLPDSVLNLVVEGVFDHFPTLRMALIEGGWTWLPSLMWRFDKDWKGLRARGARGSRRRLGVHPRAHAPRRCSRSTRRPIRSTC